MIIEGNCLKCGSKVQLDIGDKTKEQAIELLKEHRGFECPGHHVELGSPYPNYWRIDDWEMVEGKAPSEEEFLADLKSKAKEVRTTEEMRGLIAAFAYGEPLTNDGYSWSFCHSPKGTRYYYR